MAAPDFNAVAYVLAYQFALAVGIGHRESVRHAALAAVVNERSPEGFDRIAHAIRDAEDVGE